MDRLEDLHQAHRDPEGFAAAYLDYIARLTKRLDTDAIGRFIRLLLAARDNGRSIFFCGNGGSAATASHFANDVAIGSRAIGKPFRAISLADNNALMTAVANDDGYDQLFVRQLQVLMQPGDVIVAISASGNSPNIVAAVHFANERGGTTVGLTGFDGGQLMRLAHLAIHVPTAKGEYGPVEDLHMVVNHLTGAFLAHSVRHQQPLVAVTAD